MRKSTSWACAAILSAAAGGTFTHASAGGQNPTPAPPPRQKPTAEVWLPEPGSDPKAGRDRNTKALAPDPASAFPDLVLPDIPGRTEADYQKRLAAFEKMCPRLHGTIALKIEPTDDTPRKLLKARLHQGTLEFQAIERQNRWEIAGPDREGIYYLNCLLDIQSTATELWVGEPKELTPWLEEVLIAFKRLERFTRIRVENRSIQLSALHTASRLRLMIEADLWKLKNPK